MMLELLKMGAALLFVLGLMGALVLVLKKLGLANPAPITRGDKRLKIVESVPLDARRRLMLIQRDDVQHLVICGQNGETVVETGIKSLDNEDHAE
ncbi:MAG: flagellar biosynthetic protein FliO [Alphaproteobacteria bacterium]|nr:flagellar biosynthetic protein FliO [Alphaproteobacteria bacterium]